MTDFKLILSQVNQTLCSLPDWNNLEDFASQFYEIWLKLGNCVQQQLVQAQIDLLETQYPSPRTKRVELTEKTLANQVEQTGNQLQTREFNSYKEPETEAQFKPTNLIARSPNPDLLYVGVDGVMTPLNQKGVVKSSW